jgi:hypothetical protein
MIRSTLDLETNEVTNRPGRTGVHSVEILSQIAHLEMPLGPEPKPDACGESVTAVDSGIGFGGSISEKLD